MLTISWSRNVFSGNSSIPWQKLITSPSDMALSWSRSYPNSASYFLHFSKFLITKLKWIRVGSKKVLFFCDFAGSFLCQAEQLQFPEVHRAFPGRRFQSCCQHQVSEFSVPTLVVVWSNNMIGALAFSSAQEHASEIIFSSSHESMKLCRL